MTRTVKVSLEADPAKFIGGGIEPCRRSVEDFKGTLSSLDRAIKTLPDVKVTAETTDAELKLAAVKEELKELGERGATIDVHLAAAQVARMKAELAALTSGPGTSLAVHLAATQTLGELEKLGKTLPPVAEHVGEKVSVSLWSRIKSGAVEGFRDIGSAVSKGFDDINWKDVLTSKVTLIAGAAILFGQSIGAAITTGIGLAGIAGGVILAFHDPAIKKASKDLVSTITGDLQNAAHPFVEPLLKGIGILKAGFKDALPSISNMFKQLSDSVPGLARGVSGFLTGLTNGLTDAAIKAKPFVDMFAEKLPETGRVIGNLFREINFDATASKEGLNMFFNYINTGVKELGLLIQGLERLGQGLNWVVKNVTKIATFGQATVDLASGSQFLGKSLATVKDTVDGLNPSLALTADDISKLTSQVTTLTPSVNTLAGAMSDAVFKSMMGMDQAALSVAKSLTNVTDVLGKNKRALDIHTAAGQADREAILGAVQANIQQYDAMIQAGMGADDATKAYNDNTAALERQLRSAGLTQQQVDGLIGKYRQVPNKVNTLMAMQGLTDAINGLADLLRLINGLPDKKSITIEQRYTTVGEARAYGHGPIHAQALGGVMIPAANGLAYGAGIYPASSPPLIKFAEPQTRGETLIPNYGIPAQRGLALADYAASHFGGRVVGGAINLSVTVRDDTGRMLQVIRSEVRSSFGGDVQLALGNA